VERCPKKMSRNHLISYKLGLEFAINFDFWMANQGKWIYSDIESDYK
jgi:hypothetical protein